MARVTLEHVYKIYAGNVTAVRDVNLEIADKEFVVLVGPSGCGKSTTFIARVEPHRRCVIGQEVAMALDLAKCHLFNPATGAALF